MKRVRGREKARLETREGGRRSDCLPGLPRIRLTLLGGLITVSNRQARRRGNDKQKTRRRVTKKERRERKIGAGSWTVNREEELRSAGSTPYTVPAKPKAVLALLACWQGCPSCFALPLGPAFSSTVRRFRTSHVGASFLSCRHHS